MKFLHTVCLLMCAFKCSAMLGDVHTSIAHMKQLVLVEQDVIRYLKEVLFNSDNSHVALKRYVEQFPVGTADQIVSNPVNSYHFFQYVVSSMESFGNEIKSLNNSEVVDHIKYIRSHSLTPSQLDVKGAAWSLVQLQDMYNLSMSELIEGKIYGSSATKKLSVDDCLLMAQQSYQNLEFELSKDWTAKAIEILNSKDPPTTESLSKINEIKAKLQGRELMGGIMATLAKNADRTSLDKLSGVGIPASFQKKIFADTDEEEQVELVEKRYKSLCREEDIGVLEDDLFCAFVHGQDAYRKLMPFKAELLYNDPIMIKFHDVLSDREAQYIQNQSMPKLETTQVHSYVTYEAMKSIARNGKTSWVGKNDGPEIERIFARITQMTGLSTEFAEKMHTLNYGVGGHYDIHIDFFDLANKNVSPENHSGDRIATVLFYLNDVEVGGSTVFPVLGVGVKPEKGSAVMWFNLLRNGKGDFRTLHASCPVLLGEKWIANLWLHERGQEFIWSCGLDPEE